MNIKSIYKRLFSTDPTQPLVGWDSFLGDPRMDTRLVEMLKDFDDNISTYWSVLCRKHVHQLLDEGYENFKQTIGQNYFIQIVGQEHPQFLFLKDNLPEESFVIAREGASFSRHHKYFTKEQSDIYNLMTYLLWDYTERRVGSLLAKFSEPAEGNPPAVKLHGRNISQDLANSVLEYHSISQGVTLSDVKTVMELGGGYGRTAYVFLKLFPYMKYIMVDVPPALYIAERYLSNQLKARKIFKYRSFEEFSEIEQEFLESDIVFLMPKQLELLPDHCTDLFIAIDCMHEMKPEHIKDYYKTTNRLSKYFYQKCKKETTVRYDNVTLTHDDYPFLPHWKTLFNRECAVQTQYFEALFNTRE